MSKDGDEVRVRGGASGKGKGREPRRRNKRGSGQGKKRETIHTAHRCPKNSWCAVVRAERGEERERGKKK